MQHIPARKNQKLALIQTFRGLASLLVVLYHATEISPFKFNQSFLNNLFLFGSSGVDFFFVLSGFIIFYIHRGDIGYKKKFKPFILKRFIRIYPNYWVVTIIMLFVNLINSQFWSNPGLIDTVVKSILLIPQNDYPIVGPAWTLSYELLFYLAFSLLILLKPKYSLPIVSSWLVVSLSLFIGKLINNFEVHQLYIKFLFSSYNLEFALGLLAAYIVYKFKLKLKTNHAILLLTLGIAIFSLYGVYSNTHPTIRNIHIITYGISSMLIIVGGALIDLRSILKAPFILLYLGDASYSIYLTNKIFIPILSRIAIATKLETVVGYFLSISLVISLTVVLGCIFYSYIEKPLLNWLREKIIKRYSSV